MFCSVLQGGYSSAVAGSGDPYSYYSYNSYIPYPAQEDLSAAAWSTGDQMPYLSGYDYNAMMADYGYAQNAFGWYSGSDGGTWAAAPVQGLKDDKSYVGSYYGVETAPAYNGGANGESDSVMNSVEQGIEGISIGRGGVGKQDVNDNGYSNGLSGSAPTGGQKKMSWASVASQPALPLKQHIFPRAPVQPSQGKHAGNYSTWDGKNDAGRPGSNQPHEGWSASRKRPSASASSNVLGPASTSSSAASESASASTAAGGQTNAASTVLDKLKTTNKYNPKEFDLNPKAIRFFIIKSYSEDDIHRSIKYGIWCSTDYGNKRLDAAFHERDGKGAVYLLFSVNGSGHFCGMAQMLTPVDYHSSSSVWAQNKWKGQFEVNWIYVKDVPNSQLRHIKLENNENKPVTNSRDTQEVPIEKGKQVLRIIHSYRHTTSIFDDFSHYEKRQEEDSGSAAGKKVTRKYT